ncbi:MAG TPA: flagellar hook-basal body complex protein FliE [Gaiellaceae bacterium]|jgi:flagellar hook-basal body complex protein FliE
MTIPPISGIGGLAGLAGAPTTTQAPAVGKPGGGGFGGALAGELGKLEQSQQTATTAANQLATGQATDISTVAMQVEQASLSLQLAVQVRNKAVDAYNELMRMQI